LGGMATPRATRTVPGGRTGQKALREPALALAEIAWLGLGRSVT
jgi:hypothetical protein